MEMFQRVLKPVSVVPAFVERLENVEQLLFPEAIEMRNHGVKFVNVVALHCGVQRAAIHTNGTCPIRKAVVYGGEPASEGNDALPECAFARRTRNGQRVKHEEIH